VGVFNDIQNALTNELSGISGLPVIYYENNSKEPTNNTPWIRPQLLPARSELYTLNDGNRHQGIYQVDIFTKLKKGSAEALLIADTIRDHFNKITVTSNSTNVHIQEISISRAERKDGWWNCYVEINYLCVA
tara:strand:+ start:11777 stop:12172 length:396 start_codon:yes stop_codon:yes gene_type:complete